MKKIDKNTLEALKIVCYEIALAGMIDKQTMTDIKRVAEKFLLVNGYDINWVKCDLENNPPDSIDHNQLVVDISEVVMPGSLECIMHKIIL